MPRSGDVVDQVRVRHFADGLARGFGLQQQPGAERLDFGALALRGPTTSQYTSGESSRWPGSTSCRSPEARLSAISGMRASARPCPASAACTICCA